MSRPTINPIEARHRDLEQSSFRSAFAEAARYRRQIIDKEHRKSLALRQQANESDDHVTALIGQYSGTPSIESRGTENPTREETVLVQDDLQRHLVVRHDKTLQNMPRKRKPDCFKPQLPPMETCSRETLIISQTLKIDLQWLKNRVSSAATYDSYLIDGILKGGLDMDMSSTEVTDMQCKLQALLSSCLSGLGEQHDMELNLLSSFKGKLTQAI
jgi:hypothetical protein